MKLRSRRSSEVRYRPKASQGTSFLTGGRGALRVDWSVGSELVGVVETRLGTDVERGTVDGEVELVWRGLVEGAISRLRGHFIGQLL